MMVYGPVGKGLDQLGPKERIESRSQLDPILRTFPYCWIS